MAVRRATIAADGLRPAPRYPGMARRVLDGLSAAAVHAAPGLRCHQRRGRHLSQAPAGQAEHHVE